MKCADVKRAVDAELDGLRRRLQAKLPGLLFVGVVVADEDCDASPGAMHIETQVTTRPDFPEGARADIMESAAAQVRGGAAARES